MIYEAKYKSDPTLLFQRFEGKQNVRNYFCFESENRKFQFLQNWNLCLSVGWMCKNWIFFTTLSWARIASLLRFMSNLHWHGLGPKWFWFIAILNGLPLMCFQNSCHNCMFNLLHGWLRLFFFLVHFLC